MVVRFLSKLCHTLMDSKMAPKWSALLFQILDQIWCRWSWKKKSDTLEARFLFHISLAILKCIDTLYSIIVYGVYVCVCAHVCNVCRCTFHISHVEVRGQPWSWFSPSFMWILIIKPRSLDLQQTWRKFGLGRHLGPKWFRFSFSLQHYVWEGGRPEVCSVK